MDMGVADILVIFIPMIMFSLVIDKLIMVLEEAMHRIPGLPDKFEIWFVYLTIFVISYLIFWQGNFSFFSYFDFAFNYKWQDYATSALIISGGSAFIKTSFGVIEQIPMNLAGLRGAMRSVVSQTRDETVIKKRKVVQKREYSSNDYSDDI
jgi:hypothetical protein